MKQDQQKPLNDHAEEKKSEQEIGEQGLQTVVGAGLPMPKWLLTDKQRIADMRIHDMAASTPAIRSVASSNNYMSPPPRRTNSSPAIASEKEYTDHHQDLNSMINWR